MSLNFEMIHKRIRLSLNLVCFVTFATNSLLAATMSWWSVKI